LFSDEVQSEFEEFFYLCPNFASAVLTVLCDRRSVSAQSIREAARSLDPRSSRRSGRRSGVIHLF